MLTIVFLSIGLLSLSVDKSQAIAWMKLSTVGGGECWTPANKDITNSSDNRVICAPEDCPAVSEEDLPPICGGKTFPHIPPSPPIPCSIEQSAIHSEVSYNDEQSNTASLIPSISLYPADYSGSAHRILTSSENWVSIIPIQGHILDFGGKTITCQVPNPEVDCTGCVPCPDCKEVNKKIDKMIEDMKKENRELHFKNQKLENMFNFAKMGFWNAFGHRLTILNPSINDVDRGCLDQKVV
ncbi:hypothetical protein [Candidatus Nitrosocosmicus sp. T]